MLSEATLDYGRSMMTALLGVDRLYREESGDQDGLAVLNLDSGHEFAPEGFASYAEAATRFAELTREATWLPEGDRRRYYDDVCRSTLAFIAWRTGGLSFNDQLDGFLRVPGAPATDQELVDLRSEIGALLDRMGYRGGLSTQAAAWEQQHLVPPNDVASVLTELLDAAWDRTEERLLPIPAPKSDGMRVKTVSGVAFNARCNFLDRQIELNTDPTLTRPGLKHLAVHEGYPGHYVQFILRQTGYAAGTSPADGLISVVNTASSSVFEGIADAGIQMIDWIENDDDRLQGLLNRYRSGIGTGAAWRLHSLGWPEGKVSEWLGRMTLTGGEGWVANRMAFIKAPARAVLIWSYWWGEPTVASAWSKILPERRDAFLSFLHGRMHSNASVGMFA